MILSESQIRDNVASFIAKCNSYAKEKQQAQKFLIDFFAIFGIGSDLLNFEEKVKISTGNGNIDMLWNGQILVEMKSAGEDMLEAYDQAVKYFIGLSKNKKKLPRFILVCDFHNFHLYDLGEKKSIDSHTLHQFTMDQLDVKYSLFLPLIGGVQRVPTDQDPVNIQAAEMMGELHDTLKKYNYTGHQLEVYLVRLLFCLFADDTNIFIKDSFKNFIENSTDVDGNDLTEKISRLFQELDTPINERFPENNSIYNDFAYINGNLFREQLRIPPSNKEIRDKLLQCCNLDWSKISPAIFGAMFQSIMNPKERRNLGAHYTSEENILKVINPLFMDGLRKEFEAAGNSKDKLKELHTKLSKMRFLDPACGCGNFLITTYKELRMLELEIVKKIYTENVNGVPTIQLPISTESVLLIDVDQFYGIEFEEFPARIAEVALWLIDHQMNLLASKTFGRTIARLPLKKHGNILNGDALSTDWEVFFPKTEYNYILGNPPFLGSRVMSPQQKAQVKSAYNNMTGAGDLDYVTVWYLKAAQYIQDTNIRVAFVSTNSICQGLQASILWGHLMSNYNIKIHFAHQTFKWSNEAKGKAAVYCVIVGFSNTDVKNKEIFEYEDIKGKPRKLVEQIHNINNYLLSGETVIVSRQQTALSDVPEMFFGNMPLDGGNFLFTDAEKEEFLKQEPDAEKFILPLISAHEFLNGKKRWCLWLKDAEPNEIRALPKVMERVEAVRRFRLDSVAEGTRNKAQTPTLFNGLHRADSYILIPSTSSERREYIPIAFFGYNEIANNSCHIIPDATMYHFGILTSKLHMTWVRYICGRLKSDYRYSKDVVYNNFVFPEATQKQKAKIEKLAQAVLDARANHPKSTLADLYDPNTMPEDLRKAHNALDKAVDNLYGIKGDSDSARMVKLLALYKEKTAPLEAASQTKTQNKKKERTTINKQKKG